MIRAYAEHHQKTEDLALELPTGTGKTLPGLLIAEWVRRKGEGPVLYATPTKQLARQVASTAGREGVPCALLLGSALSWDFNDETAVRGGDSIGIVAYSAIFNSSPKVPEPRLIVFDDAHAGEQFAGNTYSVSIRRHEEEEASSSVSADVGHSLLQLVAGCRPVPRERQDTVAKTEAAARVLAGDGVPVTGRDDLDRHGLESFAREPKGVLGLANRYDGLDLPGKACRIVVLGGKPDAVGLQEKFLGERADAGVALAERLRTRIVQGAGRCTRGPNDFAVVVVLGRDITSYFSKPDNRQALEPDLQAEVEFGWHNSKGADPDTVLENVRVFLEHDVAWRENGEPMVAEFRQDAVKVESPASAALGEAASLEVEAWELAFTGNWTAASDKLQEAVTHVGADATRGYRGLLIYLAGVWLHLGAQDETGRARAWSASRSPSSPADPPAPPPRPGPPRSRRRTGSGPGTDRFRSPGGSAAAGPCESPWV